MLSQKFTPHVRKLIEGGHEDIKNQFVPQDLEENVCVEELEDPIGDSDFSSCKGLIHRYPNRVLLLCALRCAVHCRFCFRRDRVGTSYGELTDEEVNTCFSYIKRHKKVQEIILSGGDPLYCRPKYLSKICAEIANINHIKILRLHTRIPSVAPNFVTDRLIEILKSSKKVIWCVVHINSADEITPEFKKAVELLQRNGVFIVTQTVLLKGINATADKLHKLFTELLWLGIKPYYLHYPDLAQGTSHFRIPLEEALQVYEKLKKSATGLAVPHLIVDLPHGKGKVAIGQSAPKKVAENTWEFTSPLTGEKISISYPICTK